MKLTGERPIEGSTPDSLLALHEAGYREVAARHGEESSDRVAAVLQQIFFAKTWEPREKTS